MSPWLAMAVAALALLSATCCVWLPGTTTSRHQRRRWRTEHAVVLIATI